jgi:hypothetical protein
MGLFFDVLSSINNPNQQGSVEQLSGIMNSIQDLASNQGMNRSTTQSILSAMSGPLRSVLQQQGTGGNNLLNTMMGQMMGGGTPNPAMLESLMPPQLQQQIVQTVSRTTGLDAGMIQTALPTLTSAVLGLLNMGSSTTPGAQIGGNPLLSAFLGSDSTPDLGDVFKFANRFLNPA